MSSIHRDIHDHKTKGVKKDNHPFQQQHSSMSSSPSPPPPFSSVTSSSASSNTLSSSSAYPAPTTLTRTPHHRPKPHSHYHHPYPPITLPPPPNLHHYSGHYSHIQQKPYTSHGDLHHNRQREPGQYYRDPPYSSSLEYYHHPQLPPRHTDSRTSYSAPHYHTSESSYYRRTSHSSTSQSSRASPDSSGSLPQYNRSREEEDKLSYSQPPQSRSSFPPESFSSRSSVSFPVPNHSLQHQPLPQRHTFSQTTSPQIQLLTLKTEHQQQQETDNPEMENKKRTKESPKQCEINSPKVGPTHRATIKIVQQPLHARMCGFGEKDRRPIDPPPIVQLILDEPNYNEVKSLPKPIAPVKPRKCKRKGAKRGRKPGKKTLERLAAAAAAAAAASKSHEDDDEDEEDEDQNDGEEDNMDLDEISGQNRDAKSKKLSDSDKQSPQQPRRRGRPSRANLIESHMSKKDEDSDDLDDSDQEWPRYEGGAEALRQDPLYVCQVSLWSEDGTEVRNMISTPGKTDPPRLTRILMGALVVSPTLLYNENNEMGWYFSFPDLSVRTEGVYTLKFSLLQFSNFDFDEKGGSHASTLVAEEISEPLTVYSAKKFPGMTESTELSKAFARQGLKIPIRNDLRVRKVTESTPPLFSTAQYAAKDQLVDQ